VSCTGAYIADALIYAAVDRATAELATALASRYRLNAADATHLATALSMGADRFRIGASRA